MKKPFSIRVEQRVTDKFKALSTIQNVDGAKLLEELIDERVMNLSEEERQAFDVLLKIWRNSK